MIMLSVADQVAGIALLPGLVHIQLKEMLTFKQGLQKGGRTFSTTNFWASAVPWSLKNPLGGGRALLTEP